MPDPTQSFGKYDNLKQIGRGGFATVYRATDSTLGREVALKILHPHYALEPDFAERFLHEARTVAALNHPNIVTLYEVGDLDGQLFIAMELVEGGSLHERLQQVGPMGAVETVELLGGIADALDYAHSRELIHRDIKPANILLKTSHRDTLRPILTDFGLVKALTASTALTRSGTILGTLEYMAPEQIDAEYAGDIGPAADIYALGIVAYHMLTGAVPFSGSTVRVMNGHLTKTPPAPSDVRDDLPRGLSDAVLKALEKQPQDRFASATAFVDALRAGISAAPVAPPPVLESAPVDVTPPPLTLPEPAPVVRAPAQKVEPKPVAVTPPPAVPPTLPADSSPAPRSRFPLILTGVAAVAVIVLAVILSGMFGGNAENRKATEEARQDATATRAAQINAESTQVARADITATAETRDNIIATATAVVAAVRDTPTPDLTATAAYKTAPTPTPVPTATPPYDHATITNISVSSSRYVVDFETAGFTPQLPGQHVHFFWNTVAPENAGLPGSGPWQLYPATNGGSGASPFTLYTVDQRPSSATKICVLVANADHSVQQGTGNCYNLP